jgi:hypothetical protein
MRVVAAARGWSHSRHSRCIHVFESSVPRDATAMPFLIDWPEKYNGRCAGSASMRVSSAPNHGAFFRGAERPLCKAARDIVTRGAGLLRFPLARVDCRVSVIIEATFLPRPLAPTCGPLISPCRKRSATICCRYATAKVAWRSPMRADPPSACGAGAAARGGCAVRPPCSCAPAWSPSASSASRV